MIRINLILVAIISLLLPADIRAEYLLAHIGSTRVFKCIEYNRSASPAEEGAKLLNTSPAEIQTREAPELGIIITVKLEKDWFSGAMFFQDLARCRAVLEKVPEIHYGECYKKFDCFVDKILAAARAPSNPTAIPTRSSGAR